VNAVASPAASSEAIAAGLIRRRRADRRWERASLLFGVGTIGTLTLLALVHPLLGLPEPNAVDLNAVLSPPSAAHPFGTDDTGRDILSRCLSGLGLDLRVAVQVTALSLIIGIAMGALAGFLGGSVDTAIMRLADVMLAFPLIVLVIVVIAVFGPGLTGVYIGVPAAGWPVYARLTRAEMLTIRERDYVSAARTLGYPTKRIFFRHALPNVIQPAVVLSSIDVVMNIVLLATLSFLGLGVQPPTAELGSIISDGQQYMLDAWWIAVLPGIVLVIVGLGFSLIGDGLASRLRLDAWRR
jgi:peptide/nickel transport system permease protein